MEEEDYWASKIG